MGESVELGVIDVPGGTMMVLDPGLARFWRHAEEPRSPRSWDPPAFDMRVVGPDAEAAGRAYDRSWDPFHLFDVSRTDTVIAHFAAFALESGFDARAEALSPRVPHTRRAELALDVGRGLGVVVYNSHWAVVAAGLPTDRPLPVVGHLMPEGEFEGRFASIDVVVDPDASLDEARAEHAMGVMVEHGQLMFIDLQALGHFKMWESQDGLADFVFWGKDAPRLAEEFGAGQLDDRNFGWTNVPEAEIGGHASAVQQRIKDGGLKAGVDYRPHCNLERLNAAMRASENETAQIEIAGSRVVGCANRWGDGIFDVVRYRNEDGAVSRIRVELGTPERQALMRRVRDRATGCE